MQHGAESKQQAVKGSGGREEASESDFAEVYAAFEKGVKEMAANLYSIAVDVGVDVPALKPLPQAIQLIQNWLLNMMSRQDLLAGYTKRVYVNQRQFDVGNGDALIGDDEYFYGDAPFARPYAPMFKLLWENMKKAERDGALKFFRSFNEMIEDWITLGSVDLFADNPKRSFDASVLQRLEASLEARDAVPPKKLANSTEQASHYSLLQSIRGEFLAQRGTMKIIPGAAAPAAFLAQPGGKGRVLESVLGSSSKAQPTPKPAPKPAAKAPTQLPTVVETKKRVIVVASSSSATPTTSAVVAVSTAVSKKKVEPPKKLVVSSDDDTPPTRPTSAPATKAVPKPVAKVVAKPIAKPLPPPEESSDEEDEEDASE
jgi:hypothetical protein